MELVEFSEQHAQGYRRFLEQIAGNGAVTSDLPFSYYLPSPDISVKRHLVLEEGSDGATVVGAVDIKLQNYSVAGETTRIAVVKYPVSLGIVDPKYATVGVFIFTKLAQAYPLNFLLGMGRPEVSRIAQLVAAMGWTLNPIPYFLLPVRLGPLVQEAVSGRALLASLARIVGALRLFDAGDALLRLAFSRRRRSGDGIRVESVAEFDESLDGFWRDYSQEVGFSLVRDRNQMNSIFPSHIPEFEKLALFRGDRLVGFAVLLVPDPEGPGRFSAMKIATLVEANFLDRYLEDGVAALTRYLVQRDLNAVIANTPHRKTILSLRNCGFIERLTSFYLATSRELQGFLDGHDVQLDDAIVTRGDGDGPIGLGVDL